MHPVQAEPRQRPTLALWASVTTRCTPCRQRRGKGHPCAHLHNRATMHPVQAAPRQRKFLAYKKVTGIDAPRAGSAEAKTVVLSPALTVARGTPCRQRRGKVFYRLDDGGADKMHPVQAAPRQSDVSAHLGAHAVAMHPVQAAPRQSAVNRVDNVTRAGCTPCRQRRGKAEGDLGKQRLRMMHPVQAAPRQRKHHLFGIHSGIGCTPCRQRRGKVRKPLLFIVRAVMHPVQAAPRQRLRRKKPSPAASRCTPCRQRTAK